MSQFLNSLSVRLIDEQNGKWVVVLPLRYKSDIAKGVIRVPRGFITDFASVPRIPIIFDLMGNTAHAAATIHDYLYLTGLVPRKVADAILKEAALASGVPHWKASLMWCAVRIFGASHYSYK